MRLFSAVASIALLVPVSMAAQVNPAKDSGSSTSSDGSRAQHKQSAHATMPEHATHHARKTNKTGAGAELDNSHPPTFGNDQDSPSKPKPKP